jgi:hypothetical protein
MRYREQVLEKVSKLEGALKQLKFITSRDADRDTIEQGIINIEERVEQIREMVSLEHATWDPFYGA